MTQSFEETTQQRWHTIQKLWRDYPALYYIAGLLTGMLIFPAIQLIVTDSPSLMDSLVPEFVGIAFTVFLLDRLNEIRADNRRKRQLKMYIRSKSNLVVLQALEELRAENWMDILQHSDVELIGANWQGAYLNQIDFSNKIMLNTILTNTELNQANMANCNLSRSDLSHSRMLFTNLSGAILAVTNLSNIRAAGLQLPKAILASANLENAYMEGANLRDAVLHHANLSSATLLQSDLSNANLTNTNMRSVIFAGINNRGQSLDIIMNETTILPDGTNYNPEQGIEQMERFTNPDHPDFWQPEWVKQWESTGKPPEWLAQWYPDESS